jgi:hypothetical protein
MKASVYDNDDSALVEPLLLAEYGEPHAPVTSTNTIHEPTTFTDDTKDVSVPPTEGLEEDEDKQRQRRVGAGVASGVFGCLIGGPIVALIFGFGAAYATKGKGALGDSARAIGDGALSAKAKAVEIRNKHKNAVRSETVSGRSPK